jgi:hypothetical protein
LRLLEDEKQAEDKSQDSQECSYFRVRSV